MPRRYKPIKSARHFTRNIKYSEIDWNSWPRVIKRFEQQLLWWYVRPLEQLKKRSAHNGFAVVALGCILLDALSQYDAGEEQSKGPVFKAFVRAKLPHSAACFSTPIRIWDERRHVERQAFDFADVLWHGFRCGILHEAHVPLYGRLWGVPAIFDLSSSGYTIYADTLADCPTVHVNPGRLADEIIIIFRNFIQDLRHAPGTTLQNNFKKKFMMSYGIEIENEP